MVVGFDNATSAVELDTACMHKATGIHCSSCISILHCLLMFVQPGVAAAEAALPAI
jgi:hypothetical protein